MVSQSQSSVFLNSLSNLVTEEEKKISVWRRELRNLPGGTVYFRRKNGRVYAVRHLRGKQHGISSNPDLIHSLARKRYLSLLVEERSGILLLLRKGKLSLAADHIHAHSSEATKFLIQCRDAGLILARVTCSEDQYQWMTEAFHSNPLPIRDDGFTTNSGIIVRSKSEQSIANALERYGIPYRYEQRFSFDVSWMDGINGAVQGRFKDFYPDFTLLLDNDRFCYWEHLGRVDQPGYRAHNMEKICAYRQGGFCTDDQLILTFEKDLQDSGFLDKLIIGRILPLMG